jgi:hypothetical protein
LSPKQVYKDQLKLKRESEADGNENGVLVKSLKMREKSDLAMRRKSNFLSREGKMESWPREGRKKKGVLREN